MAGQHRSVHWPPILGHGCTKIRNTGKRPAGQHKSIHWPAVWGHGWTKIRNTGKRPTCQHKSIQWPPVFGHCSMKIRNTGKSPAGQHKSIHWPPMFGHGCTKIGNTGKRPAGQRRAKPWPTNHRPLLDQAQKYWPKTAGMDWYWTKIDPISCADWKFCYLIYFRKLEMEQQRYRYHFFDNNRLFFNKRERGPS